MAGAAQTAVEAASSAAATRTRVKLLKPLTRMDFPRNAMRWLVLMVSLGGPHPPGIDKRHRTIDESGKFLEQTHIQHIRVDRRGASRYIRT